MKRRWPQAMGVCLALIAASSIPYLYAFFLSPPGTVYTGLHTINTADTSTYLALVKQGAEGRIRMRNLHTGEPHRPFTIRPLYMVAGRVAGMLKARPAAAYHVVRPLAGLALLLCIFHFLRHFFESGRQRLFCLLLIGTSSGLGWVAALAGTREPIDLWMPEANTFLSVYESPHFCLSMLLMIAVFDLVLGGRGALRSGTAAVGILALWLAFEHPFDLAVLLVVPLAVIAVDFIRVKSLRKDALVRIVFAASFALSGILYHLYMIRTEPVFGSWAAQNIMPMPDLYSLAMGFGLLVPLAAAGLAARRSQLSGLRLLPGAWCVLAVLLAALPLRFQRRMLEGLHIPLCILAAWGALWFTRRALSGRPYLKMPLAAAFLLLASLSNVLVVAKDFRAFRKPNPPLFLPEQFQLAVEWLDDHGSDDDVVLSVYPSGNLIPGISGRRVYIGHKVQTAGYDRKFKAAEWFFRAAAEGEAKADFLARNGITLVFMGPWEGRGLETNQPPGLSEVFKNPLVTIYRVDSSGR